MKSLVKWAAVCARKSEKPNIRRVNNAIHYNEAHLGTQKAHIGVSHNRHGVLLKRPETYTENTTANDNGISHYEQFLTRA